MYLGTYVNPKEDGSKTFMNLRWVTYSTPQVPLERFGIEVSDALRKHNMQMNKQPYACQAVKSSCIGWFMYSSKHINSDAFVKEAKIALGIPDTVPVGIAYRTIADKYGKKHPSTVTTLQQQRFILISMNGTTWFFKKIRGKDYRTEFSSV